MTIMSYHISRTLLIWKNGSEKAMWLDEESESGPALEDT